MRNALAYATHKFFQENGFTWISSPIITASDCEGAGEQFCVTTLVRISFPATLKSLKNFACFLDFHFSWILFSLRLKSDLQCHEHMYVNGERERKEHGEEETIYLGIYLYI